MLLICSAHSCGGTPMIWAQTPCTTQLNDVTDVSDGPHWSVAHFCRCAPADARGTAAVARMHRRLMHLMHRLAPCATTPHLVSFPANAVSTVQSPECGEHTHSRCHLAPSRQARGTFKTSCVAVGGRAASQQRLPFLSRELKAMGAYCLATAAVTMSFSSGSPVDGEMLLDTV